MENNIKILIDYGIYIWGYLVASISLIMLIIILKKYYK